MIRGTLPLNVCNLNALNDFLHFLSLEECLIVLHILIILNGTVERANTAGKPFFNINLINLNVIGSLVGDSCKEINRLAVRR